MCVLEGAIASGIIPGIDPLDRAGKKQRKHEREAQGKEWAREDQLRAEDREFQTTQRAEDRAHDRTLADKGFGRGRGSWRGNNRRALSSRPGQSSYQRNRAV